MPQYIDGFTFPVSTKNIEKYKLAASAVAQIYLEHGAIEYVEFVGDDMHRDGTRSFLDMVDAKDGEVIVFGWAAFDSREHRDAVNKKVEADSRMPDLIAPLIDPADPIFDSKRMAYGGFKPLVGISKK